MTEYLKEEEFIMETKPNCYDCKWRKGLPGSAHSACHHPAFAEAHGDPLNNILAMFAGVGRGTPIVYETSGIVVRGSKHGIANMWFNHPYNYDPIWLEECSGFSQKE